MKRPKSIMSNSRIRRDDSGATAIEFALVAPILFLLMIGIIELGLILVAMNVIEGSVRNAARLGITGSDYAGERPNPDGSLDRVGMIKEEIRKMAGSFINQDNLNISCTDIGNTFGNLPAVPGSGFTCGATIDNQASCSSGGSGGNAMVYNVAYCWELFTPLVGKFFNDGEYVIQSSMIVRNEGFN